MSVGPWIFATNSTGSPQWTRYYGDGEEACKTWHPKGCDWQWDARHMIDGQWMVLDFGGEAKERDAKSKCDGALRKVMLDKLREHPLYIQAIEFIRAFIPELRWKRVWQNGKTQEGLLFRAENAAPMPNRQDQSDVVWATPDDTKYDWKLNAVLYAAGFHWASDALQKVFFREGLILSQDYNLEQPDGSSCCKLTEMIRLDCHADGQTKRIVDELIEQSRAAIADGTILKHNKRVHANDLIGPLQQAIWDGVTPEEILKWAKIVQETGPKTRPTLEESLASFLRPSTQETKT